MGLEFKMKGLHWGPHDSSALGTTRLVCIGNHTILLHWGPNDLSSLGTIYDSQVCRCMCYAGKCKGDMEDHPRWRWGHMTRPTFVVFNVLMLCTRRSSTRSGWYSFSRPPRMEDDQTNFCCLLCIGCHVLGGEVQHEVPEVDDAAVVDHPGWKMTRRHFPFCLRLCFAFLWRTTIALTAIPYSQKQHLIQAYTQ